MVFIRMRAHFLLPLVVSVLAAGCIHQTESCVAGTLYWKQAGLYQDIADRVLAYTTQPEPGWPAQSDGAVPANWTMIGTFGTPTIQVVRDEANKTRIWAGSSHALSAQELETAIRPFFEEAAPRLADEKNLAEALAQNHSVSTTIGDPPPGGTVDVTRHHYYAALWSVPAEPGALAERLETNGGTWHYLGFPGLSPQDAALANATLRMDVSGVSFQTSFGSPTETDVFAGSSFDVFRFGTNSGHRPVVEARAAEMVETLGADYRASASIFEPYPNPCR